MEPSMDLGFTLDQNETILRRVNRHWIVLVPVVVSAGVIIVVVVGLAYVLSRYSDKLPHTVSTTDVFGFLGALTVLALLMLYVGIWVFRRNFLLLTNRHLIRVEQRGLFNRTVSQLSLSKVQDVSGQTPGFLATILGYGNVTVETAGAEDNFIFLSVGNPTQVAEACLQAHEQYSGEAVAAAPVPTPPVATTNPDDVEL